MGKSVGRILAAVLAGFSVLLLGMSAVNAETSNGVANGFRISPVRSELSIEKGKSQSITITVENPTNIATTAHAIVNDFVASDDETGAPRLILDEKAPAPKNSFRKLVSSVGDVTLGPKEKKDITVQLRVPADANAGGYYGAIRFVPANQGDQANVGLTASVGTIVLVTVPGNLTERLDLVQLAAGQDGKAKSFITKGNVQVITRLKNDGDIHVKPFGQVIVKNIFGKKVAEFELNNTDPRSNILPGSTRLFKDDLKNTKWFGRYTIEANIGYSQGSGNILSTKSTFWYVPTWALAVLGVLLVAIAVGVYLLIRKYRSGSSHRARK